MKLFSCAFKGSPVSVIISDFLGLKAMCYLNEYVPQIVSSCCSYSGVSASTMSSEKNNELMTSLVVNILEPRVV